MIPQLDSARKKQVHNVFQKRPAYMIAGSPSPPPVDGHGPALGEGGGTEQPQSRPTAPEQPLQAGVGRPLEKCVQAVGKRVGNLLEKCFGLCFRIDLHIILRQRFFQRFFNSFFNVFSMVFSNRLCSALLHFSLRFQLG